MTEEEKMVLDRFVEFLITENCEGCHECEPRLSSNFFPGLVCCEQGKAQWFMDMAKRFKEGMVS